MAVPLAAMRRINGQEAHIGAVVALHGCDHPDRRVAHDHRGLVGGEQSEVEVMSVRRIVRSSARRARRSHRDHGVRGAGDRSRRTLTVPVMGGVSRLPWLTRRQTAPAGRCGETGRRGPFTGRPLRGSVRPERGTEEVSPGETPLGGGAAPLRVRTCGASAHRDRIAHRRAGVRVSHCVTLPLGGIDTTRCRGREHRLNVAPGTSGPGPSRRILARAAWVPGQRSALKSGRRAPVGQAGTPTSGQDPSEQFPCRVRQVGPEVECALGRLRRTGANP